MLNDVDIQDCAARGGDDVVSGHCSCAKYRHHTSASTSLSFSGMFSHS